MTREGASEEHAQNGVRRETVPDPPGGAHRTLCAFEELARTTERASNQACSAEYSRVPGRLEGRAGPVRACKKRRAFLAALLALPLAAQTRPQPPYKVDVKLVHLLVNVKDAKGELVGSLQKGDFTVYDCGVKQDLSVFEAQTDQPLSVAVLIDTSGSTLKDVREEVTSIEKFFKALLGSGNVGDAASVYSFNYQVTLLRDFTRNARSLNSSIRDLNSVGGTSLFDAIVLSAERMTNREGRHVEVIVTDGGDTTSKLHYQDAIKEAHLADAVIYPVVVVPISNDAGRNVGGENALALVAKDTGGRTFYPSLGAPLDQAFADILRDLRRQYYLGYYPRDLPQDTPAFHPVRVEMGRPDLRPSTRAGYYGVKGP
jgi:Ca-activated chloride channel homolog